MMQFFLAVIFAIILVSPPIDNYLDVVMARHALIQIPSLLLCGYLAGIKINTLSFNPYGLSGLIFFTGTLIFWMIPRSLDSTVLFNSIDQIMHLNMFVAGFFLRSSISLIPFMVKVVYLIQFIAMCAALGILYLSINSWLCAVYTIEQQKETGRGLLFISIAVFLLLIFWTIKTLKQQKT